MSAWVQFGNTWIARAHVVMVQFKPDPRRLLLTLSTEEVVEVPTLYVALVSQQLALAEARLEKR